jgi:hypothetical protein
MNKSQSSRNQGFSYYLCLMIKESASVHLTNGSGRPKNLRIQIRNSACSIQNKIIFKLSFNVHTSCYVTSHLSTCGTRESDSPLSWGLSSRRANLTEERPATMLGSIPARSSSLQLISCSDKVLRIRTQLESCNPYKRPAPCWIKDPK